MLTSNASFEMVAANELFWNEYLREKNSCQVAQPKENSKQFWSCEGFFVNHRPNFFFMFAYSMQKQKPSEWTNGNFDAIDNANMEMELRIALLKTNIFGGCSLKFKGSNSNFFCNFSISNAIVSRSKSRTQKLTFQPTQHWPPFDSPYSMLSAIPTQRRNFYWNYADIQ